MKNLFDKISIGFFDLIIVDEAHHAMAPTYKDILVNIKPKYLLG